MDKTRVAANIRLHLERRLAATLECDTRDLRHIKIGTLVHLVFLVNGDSESIGGFNTTMRGVLELIGNDLVWQTPEDTSVEETKEKAVVN